LSTHLTTLGLRMECRIIFSSVFPLLSLIMKRQESLYSLRISSCFPLGYLLELWLRSYVGNLSLKHKKVV